MAPSQTSTASDTIMPESPIAEAAGATLDARADLDTQEIDGGLDTAEDMVDVFDERPASSNPSAQKASDELADARRRSAEENAVQLYTGDPAAANGNSSDDAGGETVPAEASTASVEGSRVLPQADQAQRTGRKKKASGLLEKVKAQAEQAASAAASAAALAAAAVTSAIATSTVPAMQIPSGMPPGAPPYPPFTPLAPNGAPMIPHSLMSVPMAVGRRAVPIAPMGVLPLPPQSSVAASLVPDLSTSNVSALVTAASSVEVANVERHLNTPSVGTGTTIGDMPKGKRRGLQGAAPISTEGMTPEERTKQKRMLRNRESAARSRDKRKTKNVQLEGSIEKYKKKKVVLDEMISELQEVVDSMQQVLRNHKQPVSC